MGWVIWTETDGVTKHLLPTGEPIKHEPSTKCQCNPEMKNIRIGSAWVHRSLGDNPIEDLPIFERKKKRSRWDSRKDIKIL
jgi:hypothetical protein